MSKNIKQKALIYCRVSSERQRNEGHGLDGQEHRCRIYAQQKGYEVEKVFRDSFSGGGDFMQRPAMSEMLNYMDSKPYNQFVVIFDDLKRLARDVKYYLELRNVFDARNAGVECPNFVFENTPEGKYVETIMAATAELERQQNRRQVMQKMKARMEKGYWPFNTNVPGYQGYSDPIHGRVLVIKEPEASIIREALQGFASGRFKTQVAVKEFLQKKKFRKRVHLEFVKSMLTRVLYAGYIEYPDWEVSRREAFHEGIITLEEYERIQERLNDTGHNYIRKDNNEDFPLRGWMQCSECGGAFTASWVKGRSKKYPMYRCGKKNCARRTKSINAVEVHKEFEAILKNIRPKAHVLNLTKRIYEDLWEEKMKDVENQQKDYEFEYAKNEEKIKGLMDRILKNSIETVIEAYEKQIEVLTNRNLVLKENVEKRGFSVYNQKFGTILDGIFKRLENPYKIWLSEDLEEKQQLLRVVFESPLRYDIENGFGTAEYALPLRVFEHYCEPESCYVEMGGIEPPCEK